MYRDSNEICGGSARIHVPENPPIQIELESLHRGKYLICSTIYILYYMSGDGLKGQEAKNDVA